jgi:hypothetical protein
VHNTTRHENHSAGSDRAAGSESTLHLVMKIIGDHTTTLQWAAQQAAALEQKVVDIKRKHRY